MSAPTTAPGRTAVDWLRRQPRRNLLVVALLPVLVIMWLPLLTGGSKSAPSTAPIIATPTPPSAPLAELAAPSAEIPDLPTVTRLGERIHELLVPYQPRWQPEPAPPVDTSPGHGTPPSDPAPRGPVAERSTDDRQLVPTTILISAGQPPIAIVNGRAYRVGDAVHGHTVIAIAEQHMLYRSGSDTVAVRLPAPRLGDKR